MGFKILYVHFLIQGFFNDSCHRTKIVDITGYNYSETPLNQMAISQDGKPSFKDFIMFRGLY